MTKSQDHFDKVPSRSAGVENRGPFGRTAHPSAKRTIDAFFKVKIRSLDLLFLFYQEKRNRAGAHEPKILLRVDFEKCG